MKMIDDEFWLQYAIKTVENTDNIGKDAFSRVEQFLLWLWAIYVGCFALSATFEEYNASVMQIMLMSIPIVTLIFTYCLCLWFRQPIIGEFDPGSVEEIQNYYNVSIAKNYRRLKLVGLAIILSAITVAISLTTYKFIKTRYSVHPLIEWDKQTNNLFINGNIDQNKYFLIEIESLNESRRNSDKAIFADTLKQIKGALNYRYRFKSSYDSIRVKLTYKLSLLDKRSEVFIEDLYR